MIMTCLSQIELDSCVLIQTAAETRVQWIFATNMHHVSWDDVDSWQMFVCFVLNVSNLFQGCERDFYSGDNSFEVRLLVALSIVLKWLKSYLGYSFK